jgi:hypothetical protein
MEATRTRKIICMSVISLFLFNILISSSLARSSNELQCFRFIRTIFLELGLWHVGFVNDLVVEFHVFSQFAISIIKVTYLHQARSAYKEAHVQSRPAQEGEQQIYRVVDHKDCAQLGLEGD